MAKCKWLLMGALMSLAGAAWSAPAGIKAYAEQEFIADFTKFRIGDTAPAQYQTPSTPSNSINCATCQRQMRVLTGHIWAKTMS